MKLKPSSQSRPLSLKLAALACLSVGLLSLPHGAQAARPAGCLQFPDAPTTLFVGTNSSAGAGSLESPFAAFSSAHNCAIANDVIVILGMFTLAANTEITKSHLTIKGQARYPDGPNLQHSDITCGGAQADFCFRAKRWNPPAITNVTLRDMKITGGRKAPIVVGWYAENIAIDNNVLTHAADAPVSNDTRFAVHVMGRNPSETGDQPTTRNITVANNTVTSANTSIFAQWVAAPAVEANVVRNIPQGDGIVLAGAIGGIIRSNRVSDLSKNLPTDNVCSPNLADGIKVRESSGIVIERNDVSNVTGSGIKVQPTSLSAIKPSTSIDVRHNTVSKAVNFNAPPVRPANCTGGWPSALVLSHVDQLNVVGNTVYKNWGEGVTLNSSTLGLIEGNTVYDNFGVNIYLNNASDVEVRRNYASYSSSGQAHYRDGKAAQGIALANEKHDVDVENFRPLSNIRISNNIVRGGKYAISHYTNNDAESIYHYSGLKNVRIFNNTLYGGFRSPVINIAAVTGPVTAPQIKHQDIHINGNVFYQPSSAPERSIAADAAAATSFL